MKGRNEVTVGIFVTVAIIVGIVGTLWLARRGFQKSYPEYAQFTWGQSLKSGQPVLLAGIQVGLVDRVDLDLRGKLDARMAIDRGRKIPIGTTATVISVGFFGDRAVALTPPPHPQGGFYAPRDTIPTGAGSPSMDVLLARADSVSASVAALTRAFKTQLVDQGGLADLRHTLVSTNRLMVELNGVVAQQSRGLTQTMAALRRTANAIDSTRVDSTVRNMQSATARLDTLAGNLASTSARLDTVMIKVQRGNGSVARLLDDPGLYDNMRDLVARLDSLTADIKANPKRYINVKVF